jgi:hypothetical protein
MDVNIKIFFEVATVHTWDVVNTTVSLCLIKSSTTKIKPILFVQPMEIVVYT